MLYWDCKLSHASEKQRRVWEQKKGVHILFLSSNLQADEENGEKPNPKEQAPNARVRPGIYSPSPLQSQHQASHISQQYNNTSDS